jgi:hypothetical protein
MRNSSFVAALAIFACALLAGSPGSAQPEQATGAAALAQANTPDATSDAPVRDIRSGRARLRPATYSDEEFYGEQCRGVAAAVAGRWTGRVSERRDSLFCSIAGASRTRLRQPIDLTVERGGERSCRAAALVLRAAWPALWWRDGENVVCALTPRGATSLPFRANSGGEYCYDDGDEGACEQYPVSMLASGSDSVALRERPIASARVVAEVAPGETVDIIGDMRIRHYAHRGVVRRAGGGLRAGDTVYPSMWPDAYPFLDWDDPTDESYLVETSEEQEEVYFRRPDAPRIEWRQVRPQEQHEAWLRIVRADGSQGWAQVGPCAFRLSFESECPAGGAEPAPAAPESAPPRLLYTLRDDIITSARFSADGRRIITESVERTWDDAAEVIAREWDASNGRLIGIAPRDEPRSVTVEDGTAQVRGADGSVLISVRDDESRVNTAVLAADGARIATLSDNYTAILWDAATGRRLFRFAGRFDRLSGVIYSPDGARIVTWGGGPPDWEAEEPTRVWDAASGRLLYALGFVGPINAFSPDGRQFAIVGWDSVTVYDTASGREVRTVAIASRHESFHSVAFSPDGTKVLTGDPWNTATVWEIASGEVVLRFAPFDPTIPGVRPGPSGVVADAHFSPDGTRMLILGRGVAQVWETPPITH